MSNRLDTPELEDLFSNHKKQCSDQHSSAIRQQTEMLQKIYAKVNQLELDFTKARQEDTIENLKNDGELKEYIADRYVSKESLSQRIKGIHVIWGIVAFMITIAATIYKGH